MVRTERLRKRISQKILADLTEMTRPTINHIECGNQRVNLYQAVKIGYVLSINLEDLKKHWSDLK